MANRHIHLFERDSGKRRGRIYKIVNDAVQAAVTGMQSPQEALESAQKQSERVLSRYK